MAEFKFNVVEKFGVLSENKGYSKELRKIEWANNKAKFDLRTWKTDDQGNEIIGKGITLNYSELIALKDLLNNIVKD